MKDNITKLLGLEDVIVKNIEKKAKNHKVLDILLNRKSHDLIKYFLKFPRDGRLRADRVYFAESSGLEQLSICTNAVHN